MRYREEDFAVDGALRDVVVLDARPEDWRRMTASLVSASWRVHFDSRDSSIPSDLSSVDVGSLLERDADGYSPILAVEVADIWFTCYFFDTSEIEFSFDPADVSNREQFDGLCGFVKWLGDTCGKKVIVTMESSDHRSIPALVEYLPRESSVG